MPLDGDRAPYPLVATPVAERDGQLSPDGQWVAYVRAGLAGRSDVYVRPFSSVSAPLATQSKWQVSTDGGDFARWLRGGRQLSYVTAAADSETRRVMVVDIIGSADGETRTADRLLRFGDSFHQQRQRTMKARAGKRFALIVPHPHDDQIV